MNRLAYILNTILLCSLIFSSINCSDTAINQRQLIGTWVGAYIQWDEKLPRPRILEIKADGTYQSNTFESLELESNWHIEANQLVLDTLKLEVEQPTPNELFIRRQVRSCYLRAIDQKITVTDEQLENTAWESTNPNLPVKVYLNYEKIITELPDESIEIRCWKLQDYKGLQFFYQRGNRYHCNKLCARNQQILALNDKEWIVQNFNENSIEKQIFKRIPYSEKTFQSLLKRKSFKRCNSYNMFNCSNLTNYHEKPGLVKEYYLNKFKPIPGNTQSGFLRVRFVLNCAAEIGKFEFEGMDTNHKPHTFDEKIQEQLISLTTSMEGWKPFEVDDRNDFDCFANLIFKFENGQLIDLSL